MAELEGGDTVNVCDFCTAPGPVWTYPVSPIRLRLNAQQDYVDDGEWYACDACYQDIEADRWPLVVKRWGERNPDAVENKQALITLGEFLRAFIKARNGPPSRIHQHA